MRLFESSTRRKEKKKIQEAVGAQKTKGQQFQLHRFVKELNIFHFHNFNKYHVVTHIN